MQKLKIKNRYISTPIINIIEDIQFSIHNGKLNYVKYRGHDNIRVTCPFHKGGKENKPSADIYIGPSSDKVDYGYFKCFTCEKQGPFQLFVAECFECSIKDAEKWLIENYADELTDLVLDLPEITTANSNGKSKILPESVLNPFESFHPYLIGRKLSKKIIDLFEVKYDTVTQSIVFPVRDESGNLVMLTKRSVNTKFFHIDEEKEKPLYLLYYMIQNNIDSVMITEAQIDALTACSYDFPCIATIGAISDTQIQTLNKSGIRVIYSMFDNDEAGKRFYNKLKKGLRKDILLINVPISIPGKKDINDLTRDEFYQCINKAEASF